MAFGYGVQGLSYSLILFRHTYAKPRLKGGVLCIAAQVRAMTGGMVPRKAL